MTGTRFRYSRSASAELREIREIREILKNP